MSSARTTTAATSPAAGGRLRGAVTAVLAAVVVVAAFLGWTPLLEGAPTLLLLPLLLLAVVVVSAGVALRALRVPLPMVLLAQVVAVVVALSPRWAPGTTVLGLIPTPGTLDRVTELMSTAAAQAQTYSSPVPLEATAFPALALALGVVALLLADLLAVGLRRPSLVAMPALVVLTVPVVVLGGAPLPLVATVATALAYALVLTAQHTAELRAWSTRPLPRGALPAGWVAAAGSGAVALALAVALTPVVPARTAGVSVTTGATSEVDLTNPLADLRRDLVEGSTEPVLRITTRGPAPEYVRTTVLDVFDGETWRPGERDLPANNDLDGPLPLPQGLPPSLPADPREWQLSALDLRSPWLPLPYPALGATADPVFSYDDATLDVVTRDESLVGIRQWAAVALEPRWDPADLRDAGTPTAATLERWTALPDDLPPVVAARARAVVAGQTSSFDQVVALQRWFRSGGGFTYSTAPDPGTGEDDLVRFIGRGAGSRVGYCEQFSAAMAVMARSLGIPARVSVGFLGPSTAPAPTFDGRGRAWSLSGRDLHAWPELFFPGSGWVRFEPTPSDRTGQAPPWSRAGSSAVAPEATPSAGPSVAPATPAPSPSAAPPVTAAPDTSGESLASRVVAWVQDNARALGALTVLVLLLLLLATPAWLRRRRRASRLRAAAEGDVEAAWAEVVDSARDLGVPVDGDGTVRRTTEVLLRQVEQVSPTTPAPAPELVGAGAPLSGSAGSGAGGSLEPEEPAGSVRGRLTDLADLVERGRYAPAGATSGSDLSGSVTAVVAALTSSVEPARRRRARWWPTSLWP